jgi:LuxR family maltose regulon positive regulatory protein
VSDTLLATKTSIPPLRGNLVNRHHLIQRLNDGISQNHRLTLISAPAGYGKSTLLSEWVSQLEFPVAWLSLEKGENNPDRFWSYIVTALGTIPQLQQADISKLIPPSPRSHQSSSVELLLVNLLNVLSQLKEQVILVLDDLHIIMESQIHQDLVFLVDHLPQTLNGLHLVVASRMDPPWPLARWRVRNDLTEVRSKDLRFSTEESTAFLNDVMKLQLSAEDITVLEQRTEGWIAGLQMASVSIQGRFKDQGPQGVSRFIESFTGSNRFILDYLVEEVINQQTVEMRDFLHEISILDQFTASLCDATSNRHNSQVMLDQVERANLFLIPLDDERQWYRYHHLFAEILNKRLKQSRPNDIAELHRRACRWYLENNILSEAIIHALEAGDFEHVSDFVSGNAMAIVEHIELLGVLRYFNDMPAQLIFSKPWLCVAYAWVKAFADPSIGLDSILQHAEQCLPSVENALEQHRLAGHLAAIHAYVAWVKGEAEQALEFAHKALENLPEDDWVSRCHVLHTQGSALQYLDLLDEAIQSFEAANIAGQKTGRIQDTYYTNSSLAFVYYLQGRLHQAFFQCQQVLNLAEKSVRGFTRNPILAHAYATISLVQLEWNEVENAISNARQGVALAEKWNQADALHFTLNSLSKALRAAGSFEEAFAINQQALKLAENVSSWFFMLSVCNEIELSLAQGDISTADQRFTEIKSLFDERSSDTFLYTKAFLLYVQRQYSDLMVTVDDAIEDIRQRGEFCFLIRLLPIKAIALFALDRKEEALSVISNCLALAEPEDYVLPFVALGAPMLNLLQVAARGGIHTAYIHKLLPAFTTAKTSYGPGILKTVSKDQAPAMLDPLSERELQVLRLLDSSLNSTDIGRELFLSQNTVRTHIRTIYSKLAVHGRIEAIQKAKELELI